MVWPIVASVAVLSTGCRSTPTTTEAVQPDQTPDEALWADRDDAWQQVVWAMEDELDDQVPSIAVAVVLDGEMAYSEALGVREWGTNKQADVDTIYRWASVSKMHTAAAALHYAALGELDLDAPITDVIPEFQLEAGFPSSGITVDRMLSHHAGLPDLLIWRCDESLEQWFEQDWRPPTYAPPGSFYNYSNSGFNLVGRALERITGRGFPGLMKEEFLIPSGMVDATFRADEVLPRRGTVGTSWRNDKAVLYPLQEWDCPMSRPAAWLHGTVADLAATAELHLASGGDLLSTDTVDAMRDQANTGFRGDGSHRVGYGQFSYPYRGVDVVAHDGRVSGFVSKWAVVPTHGFGVVVVANADWADVGRVRDVALNQFLDLDPFAAYQPTITDPSTWDVYAGTYYDPYVWGSVHVEWTGNGLRLELPDWKQETDMVQSDGDAFWFQWDDGGWYLVRFVFEDDPSPRWFAEREGVAERNSLTRSATERPPPQMPADVMAELRARRSHVGPNGR
ncbi:MAG: serine hydrolase [Myxococcales bacterium]|nr:serine hydrolase [Myxococcales bacterium]